MKISWLTLLSLLAVFAAASASGFKDDGLAVIAHRGLSSQAPENTLAAFRQALAAGIRWAELDVWLTSDGEPVLMHDQSLKRTTGVDSQIWSLTLAEIGPLDAGAWFSDEFKGEPVPTLREVIRLVRGRMMLVLEVKTSQDQPRSPSEVARKVVAVIGEEGFLEDCILASFEREVIEEAKRRAPRLKTALIFGQDHADDVFEGSWDVLSVYHKVVDEPFLRRGREGRKKVFVWTVNDPETMKRLAALGIDGVISDDPLSLDAVLGRR